MAVRQETKTRWFTSGGSECDSRESALRVDAAELAADFRKEDDCRMKPTSYTLCLARELRDALNAYLEHFIATETATGDRVRPMPNPAAMSRVLTRVKFERERQTMLKNTGKIPFTCADDGIDAGRRLAVLTEEVGEVAREICDGNPMALETQHKLKTELVQVAAVAVAWVEFLDRLT